jgi:branched-chain amino acid transport system substrate-binding protein
VKKIAALYENTDYGSSQAKVAEEVGKSLGVEFVSIDAYNPGDKNFSSQITKIKSLNPDALMINGLYNEAALISQQARQAGLNVKIFSPADGVDSMQLVTLGGKDVEGYIFATMVDLESDSPEMQEFRRLAEENGITPEAYTAITYDAAMILAKAFEAGGDDPEKVREAIANIQYQGVTGSITFDDKGDRSREFLKVPIMTVKDGTFVRVPDAE